MIKIMQAKDLYDLLTQDLVLLIDVREKFEFDDGHIKGAHHIPLNALLTTPLPAREKNIVFYCKSGYRSQNACHMIAQILTNKDIYNLEGGILAWNAAGFLKETTTSS
ncbi:MAG: Thiosulfate sulfurtransferase GlpE [Holosporales bacterium]